MSPRAPITKVTGVISVFISHILVVLISRSLYLESFSVVFHEMFLPDGTAISMSLQVFDHYIRLVGCLFSSVFAYHSIVASLFSVTVAGSCSNHLSDTIDIYIAICSCLVVSLNILSRFASSRQPDTMCSIVSSCLLHRLHIGSVPSFIFLANFGPVLRLLCLLFQLLVQCI